MAKHATLIGLCAVFACATPASAQVSKPSADTLTLEKCIALAIENSFAVLRAQNALELTGMSLIQAYGQFLPDLRASASFTPITVSNSLQGQLNPLDSTLFFNLRGSEGKSASYNISSSLNLFNGFSDYSSLRRAMSQKDADSYTLARAKQDIAFNVAQSYLQTLLNEELLRIAQENLKSSQERLRQFQEQTRVGSRAIADLYQQEAQAANDELTVIQRENALRNSKISLLRQIRADLEKDYVFVAPPADTILLGAEYQNVDRLVKAALATRADLKAREKSVEAALWSVRSAEGNYLPSLNLNFSYGANAFTQDRLTIDGQPRPPAALPPFSRQLREQTSYNISLALSWNIFDRFARELQLQQAKINEKNAQLALEELKLQVIGEVKQALGDYNAAVQQLAASEKGLRSAKQAYETVSKRYEVGSANFVELITQQAALVQAQSNRAQALFNFTFQKKILEYYLGTIDLSRYDSAKR
ncbi:MAG: TolC family protein [Chloroherpetonaceae bacterium]|nr:TolC family protein [Chloroherpetonaceae bacterium]MDW8437075.1 TolC family protein [Chloroherpetonaceae bacterium]